MTAQLTQYQHSLESELARVRESLLASLKQSASEYDHTIYQTLLDNHHSEWLELLGGKVNPQFNTLIERLDKLEAALCQIEIGQFGYCCDCEEPIETERLSRDLATQRCEHCDGMAHA